MRFMAVTLIVISVLVAVSSLFSAEYMVRATEKKLLEDYQATLDFTADQIEDYVEEITRYCAMVAADSTIQRLLVESDSFSELDKVRYSVDIYRNLRYYELLRDDCINIELYLYNGNIFTSDSSNKNTLHSTGDTSWLDNDACKRAIALAMGATVAIAGLSYASWRMVHADEVCIVEEEQNYDCPELGLRMTIPAGFSELEATAEEETETTYASYRTFVSQRYLWPFRSNGAAGEHVRRGCNSRGHRCIPGRRGGEVFRRRHH